jgi:hypothetical protein
MSSLTWRTLGGNWADANAWTIVSGTGSTPGATDDATINVPGNYVVTVSGA